jgi:YD repeat-containing protein
MPQRKSIALYRKNLLEMPDNKRQHEAWLYSHSEFDVKGNLTEQSVYTQDGALVERIINEYDENGFLINEKYLADADETSEEKTYERDEKGLVLKEFKHYIDGSVDTTTYQYDKQYRIISKITVNDEGEIEQKVLNEYRDDFLVKTQILDGENNLLQLDEFKFDEKGNSVEHKKVDIESSTNAFIVTSYNNNGRKKEEITYDEDGDIISETSYAEDEKGRLLNIIEESSDKEVAIKFTYDEQDNIIHQEEISNQGRQLVSVKREFDNENNLIRSEVYIDGQGQTLPQHYEVIVEYTFYQE